MRLYASSIVLLRIQTPFMDADFDMFIETEMIASKANNRYAKNINHVRKQDRMKLNSTDASCKLGGDGC